MKNSTSESNCIDNADFKTQEIIDNESQEASDWIRDIRYNNNRPKLNYCEICNSKEKLEQHHIKGRKHGNEIITVCVKCHKELTDKQKLWSNSGNKDSFLIRGLIDISELKYEKTGIEYYRLIAKQLTEGYKYD
ncbi:MAG: HNH endonuclease [Candidatus Thermoplasmatota archaeon]|nr:HNH endonuclease [Candidatus Thermoplasmatota archaeon]MCL5963629.1 HNH endonuclease [Candidatus Thermoplasmatota archaeon]